LNVANQFDENMKTTDIKKTPVAGRICCVIGLALGLTLVGCATTPPPLKGTRDLLNFLADGKTTRTEAIIALGQSSGQFDHGRILTYRLTKWHEIVPRETSESGWPTWKTARLSLVLVFDDAGVLNRLSLVKVNK
jgi:hypothetical protein